MLEIVVQVVWQLFFELLLGPLLDRSLQRDGAVWRLRRPLGRVRRWRRRRRGQRP